MITGKDCNTIITTYKWWFPKIQQQFPEEIIPDEEKVWELFLQIWELLQKSDTQLCDYSLLTWKQSEDLTKEFGQKWISTYPTSKSHYLHIVVCHCIDLQKKFGSLGKYSNQGTESLNRIQDKYVDKLTTKGGLKSESVSTEVITWAIKKRVLASKNMKEKFDNYFKSEWKHTSDLKHKNRCKQTETNPTHYIPPGISITELEDLMEGNNISTLDNTIEEFNNLDYNEFLFNF